MASPFRHPWIPDCGNGEYRNPILHADYSDPDAIRHGEDFYLVASSFCCTPGLPILHSRDLVNWTIVNHAVRQLPHPRYADVHPGCGVWAPSIRHHSDKFWIFFPMPDEGIYVTTADDPRGSWSEPWQLAEASGWIDPCPLWDDDGRAWIAYAYAKSRAGLRNRIVLQEMSPDGRKLIGESRVIIHAEHQDVLEGPKIHKIDGVYYILAPGGGVTDGWQLAYRSAALEGPYEERIVLERGSTEINGPHQGALIDLDDGEWWFIHFQDVGPFGRLTHLEPVRWINGWPEMGVDHDSNGIGEPVSRWKKPMGVAPSENLQPQSSDEFDGATLGLQWQWQANYKDSWASLSARPGWLRLQAQPRPDLDLVRTPHLLGQKFPAREFSVETHVEIDGLAENDLAALAIVGGQRSAAIAARRRASGTDILLIHEDALHTVASIEQHNVRLRVRIESDARFLFGWSKDPRGFNDVPVMLRAEEGGWMGARFGLAVLADPSGRTASQYADFDYVRVT